MSRIPMSSDTPARSGSVLENPARLSGELVDAMADSEPLTPDSGEPLAEERETPATVDGVWTHLPAWPLKWKNDGGWIIGGEVLLAASPFVDSAVVFVHGWGGAA